MYQAQPVTVVAGNNNVGFTLKHLFTKFIVTVNSITSFGNITAIGESTVEPHHASADVSLQHGTITAYNGTAGAKELTFPANSSGLSWTSDPMMILTETTTSGIVVLNDVTVGGVTKDLTINDLNIIAGAKYTLGLTLQPTPGSVLPVITAMDNEYTPEGETTVIHGENFYSQMTVTFQGGLEAEILNVDYYTAQIRVPAGAQPGPITVSADVGSVVSNFWYKDDRNLLITADPHVGFWGNGEGNPPGPVWLVTSRGPGAPPAISGNYYRVNAVINNFVAVAGGPQNQMGDLAGNFPADAIANPGNYNIKFEINTLKPYNAGAIRLNFGIRQGDGVNHFPMLGGSTANLIEFPPPFDTQGEWRTVTIPYDEMVAKYYASRVLLLGTAANTLDCDIAFDNFRIAPKE